MTIQKELLQDKLLENNTFCLKIVISNDNIEIEKKQQKKNWKEQRNLLDYVWSSIFDKISLELAKYTQNQDKKHYEKLGAK